MIKLCAFADEAAENLESQISALNKNRIGYIELRSISGKNVADFMPSEAAEYEKRLTDGGIAVWSIGSPLGKADIGVCFSEYSEKVKRVCETANIFHTDKIRVFSFFHAYKERNKVLDYLGGMVETAASFGVKLYHENEKEIYGDTAERVADLLKNVKGLGGVYEPANYVQVGQDMERALELAFDKSDYFHIKDAIFSTGEIVPAGLGDGCILRLLDKIDTDTVLTLEPHLALFSAYRNIDASELRHKFLYADNASAFDAAADALKGLLEKSGYREKDGGYERE